MPPSADPLDPLDDPEGEGLLVRPRPPRTWRERAEHLADATGTSPARLALGAVLAVLAVGAGVWLTRPAPAPPEASLPFASTAPAGGVVPSTRAPATTEAAELVIDVEGAVLQPGVHRLAGGSRVTDALAAAGGLAPGADGARLNLAAPLQDGQRLFVPVVGQDPPPLVGPTGAADGGDGTTPRPVDLNTADAAALDALPGIGPTTAAAILEHRREIGGYTSVDQLLDVRGIGAAKLEQLRPLVTV